MVQVSYFAWTTTAGIKFSKYDNIKEIIDQALELCFLILKWWSVGADEHTREETIGRLMVATVVLYFLNNLILVVCNLVVATVDLVERCRRKKPRTNDRVKLPDAGIDRQTANEMSYSSMPLANDSMNEGRQQAKEMEEDKVKEVAVGNHDSKAAGDTAVRPRLVLSNIGTRHPFLVAAGNSRLMETNKPKVSETFKASKAYV